MRLIVVIFTCVLLASGNAVAYDDSAVTGVVELFRHNALMGKADLNRCATILDTALSQAPDDERPSAERAKAATDTMRNKNCFDKWSQVYDEKHPPMLQPGKDRNPLPQLQIVASNLVVVIPTLDQIIPVARVLGTQLKALPAAWRTSVRRVVVDVRGNPGGEIRNLQKVLGFFAPKAKLRFMQITFAENAIDPEVARVDYETTTAKGPLSDLPLVFLVDRETASATEWLIATSRYDWYPNDTTVVGTEKTLGKAIFQCRDSIGGFRLIVTCAHWKIADKDIQGVGIEPDRKLDLSSCKSDYACIIGKLGAVNGKRASR